MKYKCGVYCSGCMPKLEKGGEPIGIGLRFRETPHGRELKGKKGSLSSLKKHKMRTNMGMNLVFTK